MKQKDKIKWLKTYFFADFMSVRAKVFDELSSKQTMFCVCGRLATGLHECYCRKFNSLVDKETIIRLEHLIKNGK